MIKVNDSLYNPYADQMRKSTSGYKFLFNYECNNPTYGYDFLKFINSLGGLKVRIKKKKPNGGFYYPTWSYLIIDKSDFQRVKKWISDHHLTNTVIVYEPIQYNPDDYEILGYDKGR